MEIIAFVLAGAAALGAVALWFADASRRRSARGTAATPETPDAAVPEDTAAPDAAETDTAADAAPEGLQREEPEEPLDVEIAEEPPAEAEPPRPRLSVVPDPVPEPDPVPAPAPEVEVEVAVEPKPEPARAAESAQEATTPESPIEPEAAAEISEEDPMDTEEETAQPQRRGVRQRSGISLPGSQRRERRAWAELHGFEFKRADEYLDDEWQRGAAASGAAVRDVVSGVVYDHEMHLVDLGGITVMAMRRSAPSDVVVDLRRIEATPEGDSITAPDLVPVTETNGFRLFTNEAGPAERFIDERVRAALEAMPELVAAVWAESDWVLAQTLKGSRQNTWDAMCAPLAALADAARTLPPPPSAPQALNLENLPPTRMMPPAQQTLPETPKQVADAPAAPVVLRPEEPLELPTRIRSESLGVVEPRPVGADEVEPIAEGTPETTPDDFHGTRVLRDLSTGSSIFDDLAEELGTDPLGDAKN